MSRPAVFHDQLERIILIGDDLFVVEQLKETVVGHVFDWLHPSAIKEHRERNESEGDYDEDDAAPVKIGLAPAGFILLVRVAIGLRHKECGILTAR